MESVEVVPVGRLKRKLGERERLLVEPGQSVQELLLALDLRSASVAVVMVNGRPVSKSYILKAGDRVKLLPLISGG